MKSDATELERADSEKPAESPVSPVDLTDVEKSILSEIPQARGLRRVIYIVFAFVFFVLGILGAILPGLPTTPFLLLMSYFLFRVSPSLHAKVLNWPIVGQPLREWSERGGVRTRVKYLAYAMVIVFVGISLYFGTFHWWLKATIVGFAILGLFVVFRLPTINV